MGMVGSEFFVGGGKQESSYMIVESSGRLWKGVHGYYPGIVEVLKYCRISILSCEFPHLRAFEMQLARLFATLNEIDEFFFLCMGGSS